MANTGPRLPIVWASIGPADAAEMHEKGINSTLHAFEGHSFKALCGVYAVRPIDADLRIIPSLPTCRTCKTLEKARRPTRRFGLLKAW